ncbi:MAG TPA: DEAD/DEAH box helicase [Sphingomicrobium sp.]|nr:DEAD/DEAH box helicase [Sphingomicrobium sp.]
MTRVPHDYQLKAKDFLVANPMAALFMDMGLGKTGTTLLALVEVGGPTLLIGPIRVIESVWAAEALKWDETHHLKFSLVRGTPKERREALKTKADFYLANPELLEEVLGGRDWTGANLVIDESSMFKNPSTKRFKILRKHLPKFARRIILTGTPAPNSLMDLWSQIFILDMGQRLETAFYRFKHRYFYQSDYMGFKFAPHPGTMERITELISDIVLRLDAKDILPPRQVVHNQIDLNLPDKAREVYDRMERDAFIRLNEEDTITAANAAAAMMKLRQVASGFVYDDAHTAVPIHDEKLKALAEILDETGSPVIVVYNFQHELEALRKKFPEGVTLDDWNQDEWDRGEIPLLFLHPASGGHGLNLQYGSHTMVVFSGSFSYEQMSQTKARIDRQGQVHPVVFHYLVARDTVDQVILYVLHDKAMTQSEVLGRIKEYGDAALNRR